MLHLPDCRAQFFCRVYQVINRLFFPRNDVHASPLRLLDRVAYQAHCFLMRNGRTGVINRFLNLRFQPLRVGGRIVRLVRRDGPVCAGAGIVIYGIDVEARNPTAFK